MQIYILFALTTAIVAIYELFLPLKLYGKEPIPNYWLSMGTFFCIALLFAPITIFLCLVPSYGEKFRETLYKELTQYEE